MFDLGNEIERWKALNGPALPTTSSEKLRLDELHQELEELREKNKNLEELNLELQAVVLTRGVEEGRSLLNGPSNSLAQELQQMNNNQVRIFFLFFSFLPHELMEAVVLVVFENNVEGGNLLRCTFPKKKSNKIPFKTTD